MGLLSPRVIQGLADALLNGGNALHVNLMGVARSLFASLLALTMSWFAVQTIFETFVGERLGHVLSKLLRFLMLAGLVAWFLEAYDLVFYTAIYQGTEAVSAAIAGADGAAQAFSSGWTVFVDVVPVMWSAMKQQFGAIGPGGILAGGFLSGLAIALFTGLLLLVATIMLVFAMLIFAVVYVMGNTLVGLALAVGPFFIPWLIWESMDHLFMGWIRFLTIACMYKVVCVTVMTMVKPVFVNLRTLVSSNQDTLDMGNPIESILLSIAFVVVASIIAYLMAHVPQITSALLSGTRLDTGFARGAGRTIESSVQKLGTRVFGKNYRGPSTGSRRGQFSRPAGSRPPSLAEQAKPWNQPGSQRGPSQK